MHETEIRVPTADGEMTTFVAHPAGEEPFPVSLLYMSPDAVMRDTRAILDTIAADPAASPGPKVCVGYRMSLRLAATFADEVAAAAGIHPGALITGQADSPHRDVASVTGELYSAFAENDQSATPEVVQRFDDELEDRGVPGVVERLPGTSHGFAMADLPVYDPTAAEHHFQRTAELWRRNLSQGRGRGRCGGGRHGRVDICTRAAPLPTFLARMATWSIHARSGIPGPRDPAAICLSS
jgi:dienelactone hydrolase